MKLEDKRLIDQMPPAEKQKYLQEQDNLIPDADGKFEECQITHEPINLLGKLAKKKLPEDKEETTEITSNQAASEESS